MFTLEELQLIQELLAKAAVPVPVAKVAAGLYDKVQSEIASLSNVKPG